MTQNLSRLTSLAVFGEGEGGEGGGAGYAGVRVAAPGSGGC